MIQEGESKMIFADSSRKFSVYTKSSLSMQTDVLLINCTMVSTFQKSYLGDC